MHTFHYARVLMPGSMPNGPLRLEADLELQGLSFHEIVVPQGVTLILHGTVRHDVTVEEGGRAIIHGRIVGCLINLGGEVEVFGSVGVLVATPGSCTVVRDGAVISRC